MNNNMKVGTDATALKNQYERISWRSILAGAVVAIAIGSLFNMLGIGLGLIIFDPNSSQAATLGSGAITWIIISVIIYSIIGGWVTASRAYLRCKSDGIINGLIAWALATIFTLIVISSTASFAITGSMQVLSQSLQYVGNLSKQLTQPAAQLMAPDAINNSAFAAVKQQLNQLSQGTDTEQLKNVIKNPDFLDAVKGLVIAQNDQERERASDKVINYLQQHTDMSRDDAEKVVSQLLTTYDNARQQIQEKLQQAKETSKQAADQATNAIGKATIVTFFMLLIGAIFSMIGGYIGVTQKEERMA